MLKQILTFICTLVFGVILLKTTAPNSYNYLLQKADLAVLNTKDALGIETKGELVTAPIVTEDTNVNGLSVEEIISATNVQRTQNGLPPLKENQLLNASAKLKVDDMIKQQYFEHTSPSGKTVSDLGNEVGYNFIVMGENLALGNFANADELLQAWMNSPGHRANILNKNYEDMGVYAAVGTYEGRNEIFAVQHFGTPKKVCPVIDESLKDQIATLTNTLALQQKAIEDARSNIVAESEDSLTYTHDVELFNQTVDAYNQLIALQKAKIAEYNKQVVAFNTCLAQFQTKK